MQQFFSTTFWRAIAAMAGLYGLGVLGYYTDLSMPILIGLFLSVAYLAYTRLDQALLLAFVELFSNPHGALLLVDVEGFPISMRMGIFAGIMIGWGIGWVTRRYKTNLQDTRAQIFVLLALAISIGFIMGVLGQDPVSAFKDGNAYLFVLYLLPIFSVSWTHTHRHDLLQILAAGALWSAIVSFVILYIFTHFWVALLTPVYELVRDLRVAEVTDVGGGVYRVFVQSQIFTVIFGWFVLALAGTLDRKRSLVGLGAVVIAILLLALSRSFWVGLLPGLIFLLFMLWRQYRPSLKTFAVFGGWSVFTGVLGVALLFAVTLFPVPNSNLGGGSIAESLKERSTEIDDAGISSRWNLLTPMVNKILESPLMGHGFGTTVTFQTDDPRARAINPDGTWTTSAMEWGWLELWIKMGILGPIAFLYIGYELIRRLWAYTTSDQAWLGLALITGLIFIYSTHFFSPYLNHPIGLGYILFLIPFLPIKQHAESHSAVFLQELFSVKRPAGVVVSERGEGG